MVNLAGCLISNGESRPASVSADHGRVWPGERNVDTLSTRVIAETSVQNKSQSVGPTHAEPLVASLNDPFLSASTFLALAIFQVSHWTLPGIRQEKKNNDGIHIYFIFLPISRCDERFGSLEEHQIP